MSGEKTIGLVMIVKNEAHVIRRCLESARPLLDYVMIVDTGSTDGTQQIIRDYLQDAGLAGEVREQAWQNFAFNRSEALAALREISSIDYGLTIDADETFVLAKGFDVAAFKRGLDRDLYEVEVRYGSTAYRRAALFSNRKAFSYKAVIHEYLAVPDGCTRGLTPSDISINVTQEGARSRNPDKFMDDARLLLETLRSETDPFLRARYTFYLAQSYRDAGRPQAAYETYYKRSEMGFWNQEVYVSLVRAGLLADELNQSVDTQLNLFLKAYDVVPSRAEALHGAAVVCRKAGRYQLGYLLAKTGIALTPPEDGLFVDRSVYDYRMLDEFQVCACWTGHYTEALAASTKMLAENLFSADDRGRIEANAEFALQQSASEPMMA